MNEKNKLTPNKNKNKNRFITQVLKLELIDNDYNSELYKDMDRINDKTNRLIIFMHFFFKTVSE